MGKITDMVLIFTLCCSFCACSTGTNCNSATEKDNVLHKVKNAEPGNSGKSVNQQTAGLKILNDTETLASCYTDAGYYYLTEDVEELENGEYAAHLMYMDFATKQEIYLCSNTGCKHNTPDCPAVFVMDEFPICTSGIFSYGNKIYVLSKGMDNEGAVTQDFYDPDGQLAETEASQAALYEMDTDGTNRHKVYSFDVGLTVEDTVLGNSEGLYFVTKKLSESTAEDSRSVTTSSGKTLLFWDADTKSAKEICKLDFDDGITRKIMGCLDNALVLSGVDYGKELTTDDYTMSDDGSKYRSIIGYAPQQQGLYDTFTGKRFLSYMATLKGIPKKDMSREIDRVLEYVNMTEDADRAIGTYSGGMKQRILIAQAVLGNPKLIVLDEPTVGLDPKERVRIRERISELAGDKVILVSTHVVSDIEPIAGEVILIKSGSIIDKDTVGNLCSKYGNVNGLEELYMTIFEEAKPDA